MTRILVLIGTRPEAVKLAPLVMELRQRAGVDCRVCLTGQHRDMVHDVLAFFGVDPDHDLQLMEPNQRLASFTSRAVQCLDGYLRTERPELVVVQGDTTTTFAAALVAFYNGVDVAHVEAGLRTGDLAAPFPEEGNRTLVARLARFHFAPTEGARENLTQEGIDGDKIFLVGNTGIDALMMARERVKSSNVDGTGLPGHVLSEAQTHPLVLATMHRREIASAALKSICQGMIEFSRRSPKARIVFPIHPSPRIQVPLRQHLSGYHNIYLTAPLPYPAFIKLLDACRIVITDSGGLQEEAPSLGKPVLVLRTKTERPEVVRAGGAQLVGSDPGVIAGVACALLEDGELYGRMARVRHLFGDGLAARRIAQVCTTETLPEEFKAWGNSSHG